MHELLAPGGLLVLLEGTTPQRFGDLTVGLLDGWWAYTDTERRELRTDGPAAVADAARRRRVSTARSRFPATPSIRC